MEWLEGGSLPAHWQSGAIKRFGAVTLGKMLQSYNKDDQILAPYMRAANVQPDGALKTDDVKSMWFYPDELRVLSLNRGDIVVVEGGIGGYGRAAYVRDNSLFGWGFQNSINRIRPIGSNDGRYLTYVLLTVRARGYLSAYCNVVSMPHLTAEKLAALSIPMPPVGEQRRIADFLDHETAQIDALIAKQKQLIEILQERWSVLVRAVIPTPGDGDWPADKLGRRTRITNGSTPRRDEVRFWEGGDFPWLNSSVVNLPEVCAGVQQVTVAALRECHLPICRPGSILVALTGQGKTRGTATILRVKATINQHLAAVSPDPSYWLPEYLLWSLRSSYPELRARSDEAGATKGGLTVDALQRLQVVMPPLDEQARIVRRLDKETIRVDILIAKAEEFIDLARERRATLITEAVTGRIDVSTGKAREGT